MLLLSHKHAQTIPLFSVIVTRSSAVAERPRDYVCVLRSEISLSIIGNGTIR